MSNLPNIALTGRMGAGKSEAAALLCEHYKYWKLSFAGMHPGGLRDVAVRLWGTDAQNDRAKLQALGVLGRELDADVWVRNAVAQLTEGNRLRSHLDDALDDYIDHPVVVDDLRLPNEAWELKGREFIIVRVEAPRNVRLARLQANGKLTDEAQLEHVSEQQIDALPLDYAVQNTSTRLDLFNDLTKIIGLETK